MLNAEIKNNLKKDQPKSTRANLLNSWPRSQKWDNFIKKIKKNYEALLTIYPMLKVEIEKNKIHETEIASHKAN